MQNQLGKERGRCSECLAKQKAEQTDEGGVPLTDEARDEPLIALDVQAVDVLMRSPVGRTPEVPVIPPDQACADRGRPGTCTAVEYVIGATGAEPARSRLHPLLFLRDMSYVGHYRREGVSFATPNIVVQLPAFRRPPENLMAHLQRDDVPTLSVRVWSFRDCPETINIISHGYVFIDDADEKIARNVQMGCFNAVGVTQRTLPVGRLHTNVRVSLHRSRGMVACSPNNALLNVVPTDELRRFWIFVRDGRRVEVTLNVLLTATSEIDAMLAVLKHVSSLADQTQLSDLLHALAAQPLLQRLLALFATFVVLD